MQRAYERGIKRINMIDMQAKKQESKQTSEKTNKQESYQNVVFERDKYGFGSDVHDFIVLKYG